MTLSIEKTKEYLEDCLSVTRCSNHPFTPWDLEFLESVEEQFCEKGFLTTKQKEVLKFFQVLEVTFKEKSLDFL